MRHAIARQHEIRTHAVVLIQPGTLPKTSSGKIQRLLCRQLLLENRLSLIGQHVLDEHVAEAEDSPTVDSATFRSADPAERVSLLVAFLRQQVAHGLKLAREQVDPAQPLSALGIDSLKAFEIKYALEASLDIVIPVEYLLQGYSISKLAPLIAAELGSGRLPPIAARPSADDTYQLAPVQQTFWFLYQLEPSSSAYNIAFAGRLSARVCTHTLQQAFQTLVDRHPALRTTFHLRDQQPVQRVAPHATLDLQEIDAASWSDAELRIQLEAAAHTPFDLEHGPIMRVRLFTDPARNHTLLIVAHHILFDGWSLWVLLDELREIYEAARSGRAAALAEPALQYADYVQWQHDLLASVEGERQWAFWADQLRGELPKLQLPTRRARNSQLLLRRSSHVLDRPNDHAPTETPRAPGASDPVYNPSRSIQCAAASLQWAGGYHHWISRLGGGLMRRFRGSLDACLILLLSAALSHRICRFARSCGTYGGRLCRGWSTRTTPRIACPSGYS